MGERYEMLTGREREGLELLATKGVSNKELAQTLCVTVKTVEKHMSNLIEKLDVASRTELVL